LLADAATAMEETFSFNRADIYIYIIIFNSNKIYFLITSVDGEIKTLSQLKVSWLSWVGSDAKKTMTTQLNWPVKLSRDRSGTMNRPCTHSSPLECEIGCNWLS